MLQVVTRWKISIHTKSPSAPVVIFYINENFIQNVLRTLAIIDFGYDVQTISIEEAL